MSAYKIKYDPGVNPAYVTHRLIRNPNYGGRPCDVPGTCIIPVLEREIKPKFFQALEENVARDGFRNPILLYCTGQGLLLSFGGSRLRVARRLGIPVPAIIVDYTRKLPLPDDVTEENYHIFFTDIPELFEFTDYGIDTHYSLERNRREHYDPQGMKWVEGIEDTEFLEAEFPWLSQ
jgi:hypothetical protein